MFKKIVQNERILMFVLYEKCSDKFYSHFVTILILSFECWKNCIVKLFLEKQLSELNQ